MSNPFEVIDSRLLRIEEALGQLLRKRQIAPENKYYSISEAAKKLHVSPITLYRNVKRGKIPIKRIGTRLVIPGTYLDHNVVNE